MTVLSKWAFLLSLVTFDPCVFAIHLFPGKIIRDSQIRFGLSPEEVGLVIDQLPKYEVELSRSGEYGMPIPTSEAPEKVLRISSTEGGAVSFKVDYELDGVGGQSPLQSSGPWIGPLQVVAQPGEFVLIRELMRTSIPALVGWSSMLEIAIQNRLEESSRSGPSGVSKDPYEVPF
jgi:hypothetical protein